MSIDVGGVIHSVCECLHIAKCSCIVCLSMVVLSHWLLQTATQVMLCVRHHVQWDVWQCAVQLMFRILTFQCSPTVILLFRPFVTGSDKWGSANMADKSDFPLFCCYTDHCQLCETVCHQVRLTDFVPYWMRPSFHYLYTLCCQMCLSCIEYNHAFHASSCFPTLSLLVFH